MLTTCSGAEDMATILTPFCVHTCDVVLVWWIVTRLMSSLKVLDVICDDNRWAWLALDEVRLELILDDAHSADWLWSITDR